jgi:putative DNA primase/helicase
MDFISEFLDFLKQNGFDPSPGTHIVADDKMHRFAPNGRKEKSSVYCLNILNADFAYGWARDWRSGVIVPFSSRSKRRLSPDERDRLKAQMDEARAKAHAIRVQEAIEAKAKAVEIWAKASTGAPATEYEARKGIKRHGVRVMMGGILVVPVLNDKDDIVAVQMIAANGDKRFNRNAEKAGYWFRIGEMPERDGDLYICEGYSTGASIHEATGWTVICAFDAGNLLPVAQKLAKRYNVTICADNDAATVINGKYQNIGLLRAQAAAEAVNGRVCAPPDLETEQPVRSRDFNDLFCEEGAGAVRKALGLATDVTVAAPSAPAETEWRHELITNKDGYPIAGSKINLEVFLTNHPDIKEVFAYDEFALKVIVKQCPPWAKSASFRPHPLNENDMTHFIVWCEYQGLKPAKDTAWDMVVARAHDNCFHPARAYFDTLKWDGVSRLDEVLTQVYNCEEDSDYLAVIFRKWLVGAVNRIYEPGCKFDTMLIIEGPQNIGKSKSLLTLCTFNGVSYFADNVKDIHNKDTMMTMQGKLIIEFAELAAWRNAETNDLKAFISRQVDMYRPPYGRTVQDIPRQCVFAGTTNPTGGYFRDVTGNRRYWPVYCTKINHELLDGWKDQLWAEAIHLYKNGEQIWLSDSEYAMAQVAQNSRMQEDAWLEDIQDLVSHYDDVDRFISNQHVFEALGIEKNRKDEYMLKRIQKVMTSLGWSESRKLSGNKRLRGWRKD